MDNQQQKPTAEQVSTDEPIVKTNHSISPIANNTEASKWSILYDSSILIVIIIDLSLMFIDNILLSAALTNLSKWFAASGFGLLSSILNLYEASVHPPVSVALGFFTIFLISELLIKWAIAIYKKTYYRWFFFPFVHWYEVIGCFPQLRVFRLLRAVVIGRRLYQMGYRFLPEKWLDTAKFYQSMMLEELSDRVLLTAVNNVKSQISNSNDSQALVKRIIDNNRSNIQSLILSMLQTELAPRLRAELLPAGYNPIASHVGVAVGEAIANTPELNFVLRKIPIAGSMIESQIMGISEKVGYNIAEAISEQLLKDEILDELFVSIADGVSNIDTDNPALQLLVANVVKEALTAFENQIKNQQWQHHEEMERLNQEMKINTNS